MRAIILLAIASLLAACSTTNCVYPVIVGGKAYYGCVTGNPGTPSPCTRNADGTYTCPPGVKLQSSP